MRMQSFPARIGAIPASENILPDFFEIFHLSIIKVSTKIDRKFAGNCILGAEITSHGCRIERVVAFCASAATRKFNHFYPASGWFFTQVGRISYLCGVLSSIHAGSIQLLMSGECRHLHIVYVRRKFADATFPNPQATSTALFATKNEDREGETISPPDTARRPPYVERGLCNCGKRRKSNSDFDRNRCGLGCGDFSCHD